MTSDSVLAGLTREQQAAATQTGPVLVLAGAGTGKTKTLTAAVAHRIASCGVAPGRMLAVTFTNKAAAEMLNRIRAALGERSVPRWVGTFHGLAARQLRTEPEIAGSGRASRSWTRTIASGSCAGCSRPSTWAAERRESSWTATR